MEEERLSGEDDGDDESFYRRWSLSDLEPPVSLSNKQELCCCITEQKSCMGGGELRAQCTRGGELRSSSLAMTASHCEQMTHSERPAVFLLLIEQTHLLMDELREDKNGHRLRHRSLDFP